jgi:hypothetical protein
VYPGAEEVPYDGVDQDCDDGDLDDVDADGYPARTDCDDDDPGVRPGVAEDPGPVDRDCDGYGDPTGAFRPVGCAVAPGSGWALVLAVVAGRRSRRRTGTIRHT